ncbi:MAG: TIGR02453 family protein [Candidatus Eisenbacteria bacterium]
MPKSAHFSKELFRFLEDLEKNNSREWFQANKDRYEEEVKMPLLSFIGEFAGPLGKISSHFVADPRPVGGSMFRIHRDVRFAKDKSPYKTAATAQFRHEAGKDVHAPGFYLHLEPGQCFAGAGIYHPDNPTLGRIRDRIVDDPKAWKRVRDAKPFRAVWELSGDSLVRPPRGYDPEHPFAEDLKRKDFIAVTHFTERDVLKPGFLGEYVKMCKAAESMTRYLTEAVGLPF